MPNFWTNTTQKIYEAIAGPRTCDVDFELKVDEVKLLEKYMTSIKSIYHNFYLNTNGVKTIYKDMYSLLAVYDKNSPYWPLVNDIVNIYDQCDKQYDMMVEKVQEIDKIACQWDELYAEVKACINQREELRRTYDHYDEKLEKLVKLRNEKLAKNSEEKPSDITEFERV